MTLTADQIDRIRTSFRQILPISGLAAELFYARLFDGNPEFQALFKGDMTRQGEKLMQTLGLVVMGLDEPTKILPAARDLAGRHVAYGVTPAMYAPVGETLIFTLAHSLGEAFDAETRSAWEAAYAMLSEEMVRSAYEPAAQASNVAAE